MNAIFDLCQLFCKKNRNRMENMYYCIKGPFANILAFYFVKDNLSKSNINFGMGFVHGI